MTSLTEPCYQDVYKLHALDISDYNTWKGHEELGDTMICSLYMGNEIDFNHMKPLSEILGLLPTTRLLKICYGFKW